VCELCIHLIAMEQYVHVGLSCKLAQRRGRWARGNVESDTLDVRRNCLPHRNEGKQKRQHGDSEDYIQFGYRPEERSSKSISTASCQSTMDA
jgi:hypothetical protein